MRVFFSSCFPTLRRFATAAFIVVSAFLVFHTFSFAQGDADPEDAIAIFGQAQDLHEKGDLTGAIKLYDKALKLVPEFPEAEYQRGIAELAIGNIAEAEKSFRRAVELRPDWTLAMTSLGSILLRRDQFVEAETILSKVIELEPESPPALTALTDLRLRTNAPPKFLQDLLAKITVLTAKANPTASLWSARAALEMSMGKKGLAKTSLAKVIEIDPNNRPALFQIADIAIAEGDIARAKEIAARLEAASANTDALRLLKANIFACEGNLDGALKQLDAIESPATSAVELRNRIIAARTTSPAELEKLLAANDKDPAILGRLCSAFRRDDPLKALDYCRRASEAEPANMNHAVGYGAALVQAKQFERAVDLLRRVLAIVPDNSTAHANLATALFQLKRLPEAKAEFLWLAEAQPKSPATYFFLGIVHDQLGEYMDALANYQQYLKLADPMQNKLDIERVNLRLPAVQRLVKNGKGKK